MTDNQKIELAMDYFKQIMLLDTPHEFKDGILVAKRHQAMASLASLALRDLGISDEDRQHLIDITRR